MAYLCLPLRGAPPAPSPHQTLGRLPVTVCPTRAPCAFYKCVAIVEHVRPGAVPRHCNARMRHPRPAVPVDDLKAVDRQRFVDSMSRAANGVNVVTTQGLAGCDGVTVSSACSVTADPPSLLVCIHHSSRAASAIESNGVFCMNVLSQHQTRVSEAFASRIEGLEDRFSVAQWSTLITGSPVLENAAAAFDCTVDHMLSEGTHRIFIARVVAAVGGDALPLVYARRGYARIAEL